MCQWGIWFIYNITFSERILIFRENRLSTFFATPTPAPFPRRAAAQVGVGLPAKPLSFATPRQHRRFFLGARLPMLASASLQSLCPSSRHANRARIFRAGGRPSWRGPPRKAFVLHLATPTPALFPRRALHEPGLRAVGFIYCFVQNIMLYLIRYFKYIHKI